MDVCATYVNIVNGACTAVTYNPNASSGFENCYPKSALGDLFSHEDTHAAVFVGMGAIPSSGNANQTNTTSSPTSSGTSSASLEPTSRSSSGGGSKAWIGGAVVGPLAGIALLAGWAIWWRRRNQKPDAGATVNDKPQRPKVLDASEQQKYEPVGEQKYEMGHGDQRHELPS